MTPPKKWEEESESEEESSDESQDEIPVTRPVVAPRKKFDDEEDSDDVADNWDEEEDSEVEREKAKKAAEIKAKADAEAAKNKKSKAQRVEEHRELNRRRRLAGEEEESTEDEDEADKRARLRKQEKDADLAHANDLLGNVDLKRSPVKSITIEDKENPGQAIDLSKISIFTPATKTQFDALSEALVPLLRASASKPHYSLWLPNFVKQISQDLPSAEIKKAASGLTALSNEKMKEEKAMEKGGKKTKAAKTKTTLAAGRDIGRGNADTTAYDDGLEEEDFM